MYKRDSIIRLKRPTHCLSILCDIVCYLFVLISMLMMIDSDDSKFKKLEEREKE